MWPILTRVISKYVPYLPLPIVCMIGFVGYHIEGWVSDRYTPGTAAIKQQRQERLLNNLDGNSVPTKHNPLEVNLSPSLSAPH